jgi:hypothetical protein
MRISRFATRCRSETTPPAWVVRRSVSQDESVPIAGPAPERWPRSRGDDMRHSMQGAYHLSLRASRVILCASARPSPRHSRHAGTRSKQSLDARGGGPPIRDPSPRIPNCEHDRVVRVVADRGWPRWRHDPPRAAISLIAAGRKRLEHRTRSRPRQRRRSQRTLARRGVRCERRRRGWQTVRRSSAASPLKRRPDDEE